MARTKITVEGSTAPQADLPPPTTGRATQAYWAILQGLSDRTIPVGTDLSQSELMRLLGLTSQPLRDALRTLASEGLVKIRARSAIRFVKADLELARSTFQFRSLIERAGARAFAEQGDKAFIAEMFDRHYALIAQIEAGDLGSDEEVLLAKLEDDFHGALISSLHNEQITRAAEHLRNHLTLVRRERLVTKQLALKTLSEHINILMACEARDSDAAEAALANHLQQALQRIMGMA